MREHINQLRKERAAVLERLKALVAKAEGENRDLTVEEKAAFKTDEASAASLKERLERAEQVEREAAAVKTPVLGPKGSTPVTAENNAEKVPWDPELKEITEADIDRDIASGRPLNSTKTGRIIGRAFAAQVQAIHLANPQVSSFVDPRLLPTMVKATPEDTVTAASGTNEALGGEGGFALDPTVIMLLDKIMFDNAQFADRCMALEIGPNSNSAVVNMIDETSRVTGSRWGGVQVYWPGEGNVVPDTTKKPKVRKLQIPLSKVMGLWYITDAELEDSQMLASIGPMAFSEEIAWELDDKVFQGGGAGVPLGILNAPCFVTVAAETGQDTGTVIYQNINKMWSRLPSRSRGRAAWFCSPETEAAFQDFGLTIGTAGYPAYLPPGGLSGAPYGTLKGRPVIVNEHSATLGTVGDIVLADFGWYALIRKGGVKAMQSIHVRFVYEETAFRFSYRVNGLPLLAKYITPANNSTNYISPFIGLASR